MDGDEYDDNDNKDKGNSASESKQRCPNCNSSHLEAHEASGTVICTECGVVVEENAISFDVEFKEGAGGVSAMVGTFVANNRTGGGRGRYGFSINSRELTLSHARQRIQDCASRLRLGSHIVDAAHRYYRIALERNFTVGRRRSHIIATCLYAVCRQEKSQHMLIDFSDALGVNVYTLGTCFLKFRRLLGLTLEIVDPALFVYRFAAHLELGDKTNAVSLTAIRLVSRMKRDWICTGRRPAGICAAALLISSRAHGFQRNETDVSEILRVCGVTVTRRLREFEFTPSSRLSLEQLNEHDIGTEMDPPCFTGNRLKESRVEAIQNGDISLLQSGKLDNPRLISKYQGTWRSKKEVKLNKHDEALKDMYAKLEKELLNDTGEAADSDAEAEAEDDKDDYSKAEAEEKAVTQPEQDSHRQKAKVQLVSQEQTDDTSKKDSQSVASSLVPYEKRNIEYTNNKALVEVGTSLIQYPRGNNGNPLVLPNHATEEELQTPSQTVDKICLSSWKTDMPTTTQLEIEDLFRTDEELIEKEEAFDAMHSQFLELQQQKKELRAAQLAENGGKGRGRGRKKKEVTPEDPETKAAADRYQAQKRKYHSARAYADDPDLSIHDALKASISNRKVSRKINYDAMSSIFDDAGNFDVDQDVVANNEMRKTQADSGDVEVDPFLL